MSINKLLIKKIKFTFYGILALTVAIAFYNHETVSSKIAAFFEQAAVKYNVTLQKVSVFGCKNFDQKEIVAIFIKDLDKPLHNIDTKKRLQEIINISWVYKAAISKKVPNSIMIRITERCPIAYWQFNNEIHLIDTFGNIIKTKKIFFGKPLLIGKSANKDAVNFVRLLNKYKFFKIKYATYIGERRWDAIMDNNIIVKLPDENIEEAIRKYISLSASTPLDSEQITSIDMRYIKDNKIHIQTKKILRRKNEI